MRIRTIFGFAHLILASVCLVALVFRFTWGLGSATFNASNFFAYLTIQSNVAFVAVSTLTGFIGLRGGEDPPWLSTLRAAVLSCTISAGIVFAFLIQQAGEREFRIDVPWSDQLLHFWLPAVALVDWVVSPGRGRAHRFAIAAAVGYPVLWGVITMVRGNIVGWYPYFFLDPQQVSGLGEFALLGGIALTLFAAISVGLVWLSRLTPLAERSLGEERLQARERLDE